MTDKKRIAIVGFGNNPLAYKMAVEAADAMADVEIIHGDDIDKIENISDILQPVLKNNVKPLLYQDYQSPVNNRPFYYNVPRKKRRK